VYGEPEPEREPQAKDGEVVLGGSCISDHSPAWRCKHCGQDYGSWSKPYKPVSARTPDEWMPLLRTMLPRPVETIEGELWGGDPPTVVVEVKDGKIHIMQSTIEWQGAHSPTHKKRAFARRPLRTPAAEVARMVNLAHGKRLEEFRWCPKCHKTFEPEHTVHGVCHGCAERELGVVF
jgi:hypothetical protein